MIPAPERESAASASPTTSECGSSRDAVFQTMRKPPLTGRSSTLQGWCKREACSVDRTELETLFRTIAEEPETFSESGRKIFDILTTVTLEYRDYLLASRGIIVTVQDVRAALSWLIPSLATGNIPNMENGLSAALLERWVRALKSVPKRPDGAEPGG